MTARRRLLKTGTWTPPAAPPNQGRTALTAGLTIIRRFPTGGEGPEDVVFDHDGQIVTGLAGTQKCVAQDQESVVLDHVLKGAGMTPELCQFLACTEDRR